MINVIQLNINSLQISSGICDNLLTCVARAWDMEKPLIFCPAMNTRMFLHPITRKQIEELRDFGYVEIKPISKQLMCGDTGMGAMAEHSTIVDMAIAHLNNVKVEQQHHHHHHHHHNS
jgi:phosphopantothenoylcysteine decarboxylase